MTPLIAVDWGTSSLRAARLAADGTVLEERAAPRGILGVPTGGFPAVLRETCGDWLADARAPCLISGMAGSRQGWREAPYCACPAGLADVTGRLAWIEPGRIAIVPGLACEHEGVPDVMRGEEVQVFGALELLDVRDGVAGGRVTSFATLMSGEFYALLRQHSILARTLPADDGPLDPDAFLRGVRHARASGSLLHSAFSARTLALFDRIPAAALPSYLSGLVIGEELRVQDPAPGPVVLIGSEALTERYALALGALGRASRRLGSEATWRGLWAVARAVEELP